MLKLTPTTSLQDKIRGCILGAVVGDAFGSPLEGTPQSGITALVERRVQSSSPWGYTDDGAMLIATAESLTSSGTIDPTSLFLAFEHHYEPARGFGRGMKIAISAFSAGIPWERCAFSAWPEGSRGNGGAVRIAPVAAAAWSTPESFERAVWLATRVTHAHDDALAFARLQATAITLVLRQPGIIADPLAFHAALVTQLAPTTKSVAVKLDKIFGLLSHSAGAPEAAAALGTSTLASESVSAAPWAFLSAPRSFVATIAQAALLGGDVDSICCLAGALAGALHGAVAIEPKWLSNLAHEHPSPHAILALADSINALVPSPPHAGRLETLQAADSTQ